MFKGSYSYSPGDIIKDLWKIEGQDVCIGMYIIYDKNEIVHCSVRGLGYISYKGYVMYSHDPYGREDRSGLKSVGETQEFVCWNDADALRPNWPSELVIVVQSGLSWEDED
tara:strand:+ start:583 stop:915 length:333 start_codon:yes stop_codon:yes gene_type:complete